MGLFYFTAELDVGSFEPADNLDRLEQSRKRVRQPFSERYRISRLLWLTMLQSTSLVTRYLPLVVPPPVLCLALIGCLEILCIPLDMHVCSRRVLARTSTRLEATLNAKWS